MNTIKSINVDYSTQSVGITLDDGYSFSLGFSDIHKLQVVPPTPSDQVAFTQFPGLSMSNPEFTDGIQAALSRRIINFTDALKVLEYTNRGYGRFYEAGNPIKADFPEYFTFLQQYRAEQGDPNIT